MVSVLILTFNEEVNLGRCLDSVAWSDDVVVVDSYSSDRTVEIAKAKGARVLQNRFVDFAAQRNFGVTQGNLAHDWVLHLDADEIVPEELRAEIFAAASASSFSAYRMASKTMFEGRWLRFAGMFPAYQVRLGRKDKLRFKMTGHGQREMLDAREVGTLKSALIHYSFSKGLDDWFARHNRYSAAEARENLESLISGSAVWRELVSPSLTERRRALKALSIHLPCRPLLRFLYMFFLHVGFLDGLPGYRYCRLVALYEHMIVLKLRELQRGGTCVVAKAQGGDPSKGESPL
jgi:glycosyltransferase involved in cell wall biosynthesis